MNWDETFVERRKSPRIPARVDVRFIYGKVFYTGVVTDISQVGMFIRTGVCPLYESVIAVAIRSEDKIIQVTARVKRVLKRKGFCDAIGVEVLTPSLDYTDFVENRKSSIQGNDTRQFQHIPLQNNDGETPFLPLNV